MESWCLYNIQSKMSSNESWTRPGEDKILFSNHPVISAYPRSHLRIIHCWAQREINSLGLSYICTGRLSWENNGEANDKLVHQVVSFIIGNTIIDDLLLLFIRLSSLAWTNDISYHVKVCHCCWGHMSATIVISILLYELSS